MNSSQTKQKSGYKTKFWFTTLLMMFAGGIIFFTLVLGTLTNNRFGTHLVFNSDLLSSPLWFVIIISIISLLVFFYGLGLFILERAKMIKVNEAQSRIFRIGAFFLMGIAILMSSLSSVCFAAFNSLFFKSQLFHGIHSALISVNSNGGNLNNSGVISNQGLSIGIITIIFLLTIISLVLVMLFVYKPKYFSDKIYYTSRNTMIALIAISWFAFNMNIIGFGSMGGDLEKLLLGISNNNFDPNQIVGWVQSKPEVMNLLQNGSQIDGEQLWNNNKEIIKEFVINSLNIDSANWLLIGPILKNFIIRLWDNGSATFSLFNISIVINLPFSLHNLIKILNELANTTTFSNVGLLGGVNDSITAIMLFVLVIISPLLIASYSLYMWIAHDDVSDSFVYRASLWSILGITILFFLLSFTPYFHINNRYGVLAPGLIAPIGQNGGISSAIVYFFPNYKGTTVWWTSFLLLFAIPISSFSIEALKKYVFNKEN